MLERRRRDNPPEPTVSPAIQEACDRMGHFIPNDKDRCCCGHARRRA